MTIRQTHPDDALAWCTFLAREQTRTYAGLMPATFGERRAELIESNAAGVAAGLTAGSLRVAHAEVGGEIVGVVAAGPGPAAWEIEEGLLPAPAPQLLDRLYLHPDHHGTGLADRLMDAVLEPGPTYLWLIDGNTRAERFYTRRGFRSLDERFLTGESWGEVPMHRMVRSDSPRE